MLCLSLTHKLMWGHSLGFASCCLSLTFAHCSLLCYAMGTFKSARKVPEIWTSNRKWVWFWFLPVFFSHGITLLGLVCKWGL